MSVQLSNKQGEFLLEIAKKSIYKNFNSNIKNKIENIQNANILNEKRGTFVTIHKNGKLRGCIGTLESKESIIEGIKRNAINAAFKDSRFSPVKEDELNEIDLEISILTAPEKLEYKDSKDLLLKIKPHIDGVIIQKDFHKATFLPQIWEQLPIKEEFFSHLCIKAGLPSNEWAKEKLEIMTYTIQSFSQK